MKGPVPYIGGKSLLARDLIARFPPHVTYVEPFCGGAQVFFHKAPSKAEILNDLDGELINFLRICQAHHEELIRHFRYAVHSRAEYLRHQRHDPTLLTDVQRAARFLYLQRTAWGARVKGQNYNALITAPGRLNASQIAVGLEATAARLTKVQLEQLPYQDVLSRYDRPETLFYCDPPYAGMPYYRFNFADSDFETLAKRLAALKGKFLLSINDHPVTRAAFQDFRIQKVDVRYSIVRHSSPHELVISNFR